MASIAAYLYVSVCVSMCEAVAVDMGAGGCECLWAWHVAMCVSVSC